MVMVAARRGMRGRSWCTGALLLALAGCASSSDDALDQACQDNRDRAFDAAEVVRQEAEKGSPDGAAARESMRVYVSEVQRVPDCFAEEVREQASEADAALKAGRVLDLGPRPPGQA